MAQGNEVNIHPTVLDALAECERLLALIRKYQTECDVVCAAMPHLVNARNALVVGHLSASMRAKVRL